MMMMMTTTTTTMMNDDDDDDDENRVRGDRRSGMVGTGSASGKYKRACAAVKGAEPNQRPRLAPVGSSAPKRSVDAVASEQAESAPCFLSLTSPPMSEVAGSSHSISTRT